MTLTYSFSVAYTGLRSYTPALNRRTTGEQPTMKKTIPFLIIMIMCLLVAIGCGGNSGGKPVTVGQSLPAGSVSPNVNFIRTLDAPYAKP
jgi:hypothetical protein